MLTAKCYIIELACLVLGFSVLLTGKMQCSQSENSKAADVKLAGRGQMIVLTLLERRLSWKNHLFLCTCKSVAGLGMPS